MNIEEWLGNSSKFQIDIWNDKYRYNNETFDQWIDRVSQNNSDYKKIILKKQFLPGGRTLSNIGIPDNSSLMNCYSIGYVPDDYEKIMDTAKQIGITYKYQGGQGLSLTKIRPKDTPIGKRYFSDGIVPFMKIFNEVTEVTSQAGSRKGALLMSLDAWHKEALNFITIKSKDGLIEKANLSLEIDDEFMNAIDEFYETGEIKEYIRKETYGGHEVEWSVKPAEVFNAMVKNNWNWGDPGCIFTNRFRNYNIMQYDDEYEIQTANPSLRAGTKVLTSNGIFNIEDLEGKKFNVITPDNNVAEAECFLSGKNKQLYKITLSNNEEIYCTAEHKWPILQKDGSYQKSLTKDIRVGEYLMRCKSDKISDGKLGTYEDGFFIGFWYADGSVTLRKDNNAYQYGITFGAEKCGVIKDKWIKKLSSITLKEYKGSARNRGGLDWYEYSSRDLKLREYMLAFGVENKHKLPTKIYNECSEEFRRGFIDGIFSGDSCINVNTRRITIDSCNYEFMKELKDLLAWYGISSYISSKRSVMSFNGKPAKEYFCSTLTINLSSIERFKELFSLTNENKLLKLRNINTNLKKNKKSYNNIQITAIELTDIKEDVWDIHVYDEKHTFFLNYCLTGNCTPGDTTILTDAGYKRIDSLVGKKVNVWNGFEWSEVEPRLTATDQEIYHIKFSDGCELNCTPYHKFILADGQRIEARELKKGTKLAKFLMPVINGTKELDHAYTQGFFSGDGYIRTETGSAYADLYHEKRNIQLDVLGARSSCDRIKRDTVRISVDFKDKKFVPDASYSVKSRLEWLAGMVDSDGCSTKDGSIQISSIDKQFLMNIKFMLNTLGINPVVSIMKHEETKLMPDQKGGKKEYQCKTSYRLSISGWYVGMLNSLGFKTQRVRHDVIPDRHCKRFIYVTSIENTGKLSDVYCFTEYKNHSGIFNGVMTAQCGEQALPKHGACCLGSINLSEFVKKQYTKNSFFDFNEFKKVVETVVRYMDDIVTINYSRHPLKEQQDMSYNYRNIGIGVMGYSNMLMKLGLEYGSREAIEFTDELFGIMFKTAVKASSKLAKERGSFPKYTPKVWKSDIIREHFSDGEIKTLKKDGLRNCSLLSVAPTGTLSNLLNISGGCEPEFALKYTRRTVGMTGGKDEYYQVDCKSVQEYKDIYGSKVKLPKYFITANQINYNDRIATQSIMQKHVDTAISSTINLPESATEDDIAHIYLNSWKRGLKGVTIFRDNCSRIPILSTSKQKKDNSEANNRQSGYQRGEIIHNDNTIGLKRTLTSGCGRLHCQAFFDRNTGEFMELFLGKGSTGGCYSSLNGLARMVSLSARAGVKIGDIIEQLTSANACPSYGLRTAKEHDTSKGTCCPSAIGNALRDMQTEMSLMLSKFKNESETKENDTQQIDETDKCPVCGNKIVHVGGCISCNICGFNKCG